MNNINIIILLIITSISSYSYAPENTKAIDSHDGFHVVEIEDYLLPTLGDKEIGVQNASNQIDEYVMVDMAAIDEDALNKQKLMQNRVETLKCKLANFVGYYAINHQASYQFVTPQEFMELHTQKLHTLVSQKTWPADDHAVLQENIASINQYIGQNFLAKTAWHLDALAIMSQIEDVFTQILPS